MKVVKNVISLLFGLFAASGLQAQNLEGVFEKRNFKCPINGTVEGYLNTSEGERIEIASYVDLNEGDFVQVSEASWGPKKCEENSFNIYFIYAVMQGTTTPSKAFKIQDKVQQVSQVSSSKDFLNEQVNTYNRQVNPTNTNAVGTSTGSKLSVSDAEEALQFHNQVRAEVGVSPLVWSVELSQYAQEWAEYLASTTDCKLIHRSELGQKHKQYGENLYQGWSSNGNVYTALDASKGWYSEIKDYKHGKANRLEKTGHYTQMVWHTTTHLGIGVAQCANGGYIVVANYNPPGNYIGKQAY